MYSLHVIIRYALTSFGPMVLAAGATTEDIRPTGTFSVSMEGGTAFKSKITVVVVNEGRYM